MSDQFLSYVRGNCYMKTQNNAFAKSQDYNIATSRKTSTSWKLVEVSTWQKNCSLLQLCTPHWGTFRTDFCKNYFSNMLQAQALLTFKLPKVFEEYIPKIPSPPCFVNLSKILAANTLPHLCLSLIAPRKDTSFTKFYKKHLIRIRWIR